MKNFIRKFIYHSNGLNQRYFEHLKFTITNSGALLRGGFFLLIHGMFPFLFMNITRELVKDLSEKLLKRHLIGNRTYSSSILDFIGNTPLIRFNNFINKPNIGLYGKCEFFNPTLSIKDRIVFSMLKSYEKNGLLRRGMTIYEASSGNTGSSLAMIGKQLGYSVTIVVPKKTSLEKINTMKIFGAQVIIAQENVATDSPEHYINKARILSELDESGFYFDQYGSEENVMAHYRTTAQEVWEQTDQQIDYLVCCASSGGTITALGKFLKERNPNIKIILADPVGSIFYDFFHGNTLQAVPYTIEGAGKDVICVIHDFNVIDDVIQFTDQEAFSAVHELAQLEGVLVGGSAGGVLVAIRKLLPTLPRNKVSCVVAILPDSGFKYLSKIFLSEANISEKFSSYPIK